MKTNKHLTLLLVKTKQAVRAKDLVQALAILHRPAAHTFPISSGRTCWNGSAWVMC